MTTALRLYHLLPFWARTVAATWRGRQLRRWRYGQETDVLVEEALARDYWSPIQWKTWQEVRLQETLQHAATCVPYYRDYWRGCGRKRGDSEVLGNWPILEKETLRQQPESFLADDYDRRRMFHEHTSGTTGKPVQLWFSRAAVRAWYALAEARWRRWYGVSRYQRWAILGGQLVTPVNQQKPPFWVWNRAMDQLYLSTYHLVPNWIPYYLEALERHRVRFLVGYTSALHVLGHEAIRRSWKLPDLEIAIANAEPVLPHQRRTISSGLGCRLRETYGLSETVAAASECEAGSLHLWPEAGVWETSADGELIATGLLNPAMPLIRYRTGDRISIGSPGTFCTCGRTLPLLDQVDGRTDDNLYMADGRVVGRLDSVFKADIPIREAQIIQEDLRSVCVLYVPADNFHPSALAAIAENLRVRLGRIEIRFEAVASIPRSNNGKFRAVVCRIPLDQRPAIIERN